MILFAPTDCIVCKGTAILDNNLLTGVVTRCIHMYLYILNVHDDR